MFKIGDFSQLGQVSVRTLHHYDERGLLKPAKIDDWTGYRFYSVDQLPRLNRILALKDLGFSLDQIGRLVDDDVPAEQLRGMLALRQAEIERQLTDGRTRLLRVEARLRQIENEDGPSPYEVVLKRVPPTKIAATRVVVPTLGDMTEYRCALYDTLYEELDRRGEEPGTLEYALYHDLQYSETDIDMEAAVTVGRLPEENSGGDGGLIFRELPAVREMASVVHKGSAWDIPQATIALLTWVGENGYSAAGPYREIHLYGRENDHYRDEATKLDAIVVEIQIPLQKTSRENFRAYLLDPHVA